MRSTAGNWHRDSWLREAGPRLLRRLTRPYAPPPGARIIAAVSGGADSVAFLHLLAALAPGRGWEIEVASLDHGLRGEESAADRRFVEELAGSLGLACHGALRPVRRESGQSREAAARQVRHEFLEQVLARREGAAIALGHTLDDQAETVLQRLGRGAGLTGVSAMARWSPPRWRPLLEVRRAPLRDLLDRAGASWREDPTNSDLDAERSRVRKILLPALEKALGERAIVALARAADLAREDDEALETMARRLAPEPLSVETGKVVFSRKEIADLPGALIRRIVRQYLLRLAGDPPRLSASHLRALEALVRAEGQGSRLDLAEGLSARREGQRIILERHSRET